MNCDTFQRLLKTTPEAPEVLEHVRSCPVCLERAVEFDPDFMFRSLGGADIPPGGTETFVADVMQQIHMRDAERRLSPRRVVPAIYRWGIAAALAVGILSGTLLNQTTNSEFEQGPALVRQAVPRQLEARPVIEHYESAEATIVEMPSEERDDVRIVMIFDETLPVDL